MWIGKGSKTNIDEEEYCFRCKHKRNCKALEYYKAGPLRQWILIQKCFELDQIDYEDMEDVN